MKFLHEKTEHEVFLQDDGTLDTVILVDGVQIRYSQEYAADFRTESGMLTYDGLKELAIEALQDSPEFLVP